MTELVELSPSEHAHLKLPANGPALLAKQLQIINLTAQEIPQAACDLPVFLTRSAATGQWGAAALTSLISGQSPMVSENQWQGLYTPVSLKTYPIFPMRQPDSNTYTLGIDENTQLLKNESGIALFDEQGQETEHLSQIRALIDTDIKAGYQTYLLTQELEKLQLIKAVDLVLTFADNSKQNLHGLHTIDEEKLLSLPAEKTVDLHKKGYITVLNAMLFSLFQLNRLVRLHANNVDAERVQGVKITEAKAHN